MVIVGVSIEGAWAVASWGPRRGPSPGEPPVFEIGSLTKPLTGALLADMYRRGEVDLGDRLADHLPHAVAWPAGQATLEQLATHRSGLPNTPRAMLLAELAVVVGIRGGDPWDSVEDSEYRWLVGNTRPRHTLAGRAVRYSSLGFGLLGDALAARAGRPYGDLLRERLLAPLGMHATTVSGPASLPGRSRRGRPRPAIHDRLTAAGGVRSTVPDLLRWLEACARTGDDHPGPALALAQRPRVRASRRVDLGLGWIIQRSHRSRPTVIWHNGLTYGFRSFGAFVPDAHIAVVALTNTTRPLDKLGFGLMDLALES
jgi:CubicO group peptidase (beta-lactamase class C family)